MTKKRKALSSTVSAMRRQTEIEDYEKSPTIMTSDDEAIKTKSLPNITISGTNRKNTLLKYIPKTILSYVMNLARANHWSKGMYGDFTLLADLKDNDFDPATPVLYDLERQEEAMNKRGYHRVNNYDYGLVNHSAKRHGNPQVYQMGKDDISRDSLDVISNEQSIPIFGEFEDFGYKKEPKTHYVPGTIASTQMFDSNWFPTALYKHKNKNEYYVKGWDLEDFGHYDNDGGVNYEVDGNYPSNILAKGAKLIDKFGNPYVRTSHITHIPELSGYIYDEENKGFYNPNKYSSIKEAVKIKRKGGRKSLETT